MNATPDRPNEETPEPSALLQASLDKALDESTSFRLELELPVGTIIKIFVAILVALAAYKLWSFLLMLFLSLFLAVTLHPVVEWLESKKVKRWVSLLLVNVDSCSTNAGTRSAMPTPSIMKHVLRRFRESARHASVAS